MLTVRKKFPFSKHFSLDLGKISDICLNYLVGSRSTVWYDPKRPSYCVFERKIDWPAWFASLAGVLLTVWILTKMQVPLWGMIGVMVVLMLTFKALWDIENIRRDLFESTSLGARTQKVDPSELKWLDKKTLKRSADQLEALRFTHVLDSAPQNGTMFGTQVFSSQFLSPDRRIAADAGEVRMTHRLCGLVRILSFLDTKSVAFETFFTNGTKLETNQYPRFGAKGPLYKRVVSMSKKDSINS